MSSKTLKIYTDGCCLGNPGLGGWAYVMWWDNFSREGSGCEKITTNNRMELRAVVEALLAVKRKVQIEVFTDSMYVRNGIDTWIYTWKANGWRRHDNKPVKNVDLWQKLDKLVRKYEARFNWIPGHSAIPQNERADWLARQAAISVRRNETQV